MSKPPERLNISKALGGQWVAFDGNHGWDFIRLDIHEAAVAAARVDGMREAAKIAQSILSANGTAHYIPTAICSAYGGKVCNVSMRITGPTSDGEYWLHLSDSTDEVCGINLDCPLGAVSKRLLDAAVEASK